jgi:hypothetical protein
MSCSVAEAAMNLCWKTLSEVVVVVGKLNTGKLEG